MLPFAVVPIILLVVVALLWTWWTSRQDRDPASSVDSFNRALTAMQPGAAAGKPRRRATVETDTQTGAPLAVASSDEDEKQDSDEPDEAR